MRPVAGIGSMRPRCGCMPGRSPRGCTTSPRRGRLARDGVERAEPPAARRRCDEGARGGRPSTNWASCATERPRARRRNDRHDRPRRLRPHELPVRRHRKRRAAPRAGGRATSSRSAAATATSSSRRSTCAFSTPRRSPASSSRPCTRRPRASSGCAATGSRSSSSTTIRLTPMPVACSWTTRGGLHRDPSPDRPRGTANRHRRRAPRLPARLAAHRGCESRGRGSTVDPS